MSESRAAGEDGRTSHILPQSDRDVSKMQGHWLLAKMGKRVLRPGGLELTHRMLEALNVGVDDEVVEFAPGLGVTAKLTLARNPARYTAIEKEEAAANIVRKYLQGENRTCRVALAEGTGLADACATVVYGEAMLTMCPDKKKLEIMAEAARILKPGGRYGIHEIIIVPDEADDALKKLIRKDLTKSIHVAASPATVSKWREMLESVGFEVGTVLKEPFHLLKPKRLVQDEGFFGALRFAINLLRHGEARKEILRMKKVFRKHQTHLNAASLVAVKPKNNK